MTEYKCPYCGQDSYAKTSKKEGKFDNWKSVRAHIPKCLKNTKIYFIDSAEGPIHYTKFLNRDLIIRNKYPKLQAEFTDIRSTFKLKDVIIPKVKTIWNKESIILAIQQFYKINNRIPQTRDFEHNINYPNRVSVSKYWGTWNKAIEAAGFIPNLNNSFGNRIIALDGVLYRSWYETEFVNRWLFNKEKYFYEVKYPDGIRKYDFYLPEKDLYIEIDGGLRPQVMEEKIAINKQLGRKLLVIKTSDIQNFKGFVDSSANF